MPKEKIKFTQEQAIAFDYFREDCKNNTKEMTECILSDGAFMNDARPLNKLSKYDLLEATFAGYEVESSPAEKIKRVISGIEDDLSRSLPMQVDTALINGYIRGLRKALSYIEGDTNE